VVAGATPGFAITIDADDRGVAERRATVASLRHGQGVSDMGSGVPERRTARRWGFLSVIVMSAAALLATSCVADISAELAAAGMQNLVAINDRGVMLGFHYEGQQGGQPLLLEPGGRRVPLRELPGQAGMYTVEAYNVSNESITTGYASTPRPDGSPLLPRGLYTPTVLINDRGQVIVTATVFETRASLPVRYDSPEAEPVRFEGLNATTARISDLNNAGTAIGGAVTPDGNRSFRWT
jgi:hypothetical protein